MTKVYDYAAASRVLRALKDMNKSALATKTGISQPMISRFESGKRSMSLENIERICEALEVPVWVFFLMAESIPRMGAASLAGMHLDRLIAMSLDTLKEGEDGMA